MTPFLRFTFWAAIGAIGATAGSTLYLFFAIRSVELFPALTGGFATSGVLLLIAVACSAWVQARRKLRAVETITIDEPFDLRAVRVTGASHELAR